MTQVSRPLLLVLVAAIVGGLLWVTVLKPHSSSSSTSAVSHPATAPGVRGLTNAIDKAHAAVATSQRNAQQLQSQSAAASSSAATPAGSAAAAAVSAPSAKTPAAAPAVAPRTSTAVTATRPAAPVDRSTALVKALQGAKVGVLLFWNPRSADDRAVRAALERLSHRNGGVYVRVARVSQVAEFGQLTRDVSVAQSPTVLVIDRRGKATTIAGLADTREISQAVGDAVRAAEAKR